MDTAVKPNKIERLKARLKPSAFLPRIDRLDFSDLSEEERFYLKNYGIYNHKLAPETFMLRLRITAGRITVGHLRTLAETAEAYRLKLIVTMRAQVELHGLNAGNVLEVWQKLDRSGLTSWQTLTDNFRNIVSDPLDGVSETSLIETYPLIQEMESLFLKNPEYIGMLPRKFNTAICGNTESSHSFFSNDLYFALAQKEGLPGFNLYLGGKNSDMAQDADIFVPKERVFALFEAVVRTYMLHGPRGTRSRTRLFHMLQSTGMEAFRSYLERYSADTLQSKGDLLTKKTAPAEFASLQNGKKAWCCRSHFGEVSAETLLKLCSYANRHHCTIRFGVDQNIYLLGLENSEAPLLNHGVPVRLSVCAGSRYCPLSLFDMKEEAAMLPLERLARLNVSVGYSGCLKGCGKHQHTDIGFIGLRTAVYGSTQKSVRLFLGAEYTDGHAVSRLILMAVPLHALNTLLAVILDIYEASTYDEFEIFSAALLNPYSSEFLAVWFLASLHHEKRLPPPPPLQTAKAHDFDRTEERRIILSAFPDLAPHCNGTDTFHNMIKHLTQTLWAEEQSAG